MKQHLKVLEVKSMTLVSKWEETLGLSIQENKPSRKVFMVWMAR
jgi:hypothetical protein